MKENLFKRHHINPILSVDNWPYRIHTVFNPGVIQMDDEVLVMARCEDQTGMSHLTLARSPNGIDQWQIDSKPTIMAEPDKYPEEAWGIEDPRIIHLEKEGKWAITYTAYSTSGAAVSLIETKDFKKFKKMGVILPPENKDAAFFPEQINGKWVMINRPVAKMVSKINMWITTSPDLIHWGDHRMLMEARSGGYWDSGKIGLSTPPLKTKEGWLILYHGVRASNAGDMYKLGFALLDLKDPRKILRRAKNWVFAPEEPFEVVGDIGNVVFPCGWFLNKKDNRIYLYYGAADTSIGLASANFDKVMDYVLKMPATDK